MSQRWSIIAYVLVMGISLNMGAVNNRDVDIKEPAVLCRELLQELQRYENLESKEVIESVVARYMSIATGVVFELGSAQGNERLKLIDLIMSTHDCVVKMVNRSLSSSKSDLLCELVDFFDKRLKFLVYESMSRVLA